MRESDAWGSLSMREVNPAENQRIAWIDCAKGIAMLLVIFSHSVHGVLRGVIFSFHMPLFFILSSTTYRCSENLAQWGVKTKKAAVHLLKPVLILFLMVGIAEALSLFLRGYAEAINADFLWGKILTLVFASGARFTFNGMQIDRLGIPWFLVVLFLGRSLYDLIQLRIKGTWLTVACIVLTMIGIAIGQSQWLPFSLDIALAIMMFLHLGQKSKMVDLQHGTAKKMIVAMIIWCVLVVATYILGDRYLELAVRRYPLFPISYVAAVAGTAALSAFSSLLVQFGNKFLSPLLFCGKNSLVLLCVHTMDFLWESAYTCVDNLIVTAMLRIILDLSVFFAIMFISNKLSRKGMKC